MTRRLSIPVLTAALLHCSLVIGQSFRPEVPRSWDDREVESFELPLAQADRSPRYMTSREYYALKERLIYRSYPVYAPGREPVGYRDWLKQREPEIIFDASTLRTKADWIEAGKLLFRSHIRFSPAPEGPPEVDDTIPVLADGTVAPFRPGHRYYIRRKGVIEVGINACADCHTRIMSDGTFLEGAQGIVARPFSSAVLKQVRESTPASHAQRIENDWVLFGAPWIQSKEAFAQAMTRDQVVAQLAANHPGVFARQGTSRSHPVHVPSLIGIQDRRYLDATGLVRHRTIGDVMRYAVINMGLDLYARFGDFQPSSKPNAFTGEEGTRYSDEQLYAMALYIYSLEPPANPHPRNAQARRGQQVFEQQGCHSCHTPPLYTNNKLTPAIGFKVPDHLRKTDNILDICVGTDPTLAMKSRRGTGFYKVPSLLGVWYRNAFGHTGQAETLEEWLDSARLEKDYIPRGFHIGPGAIKGHEFGLKLSPADKHALIAFLKTL
jgi:hypothetical protein